MSSRFSLMREMQAPHGATEPSENVRRALITEVRGLASSDSAGQQAYALRAKILKPKLSAADLQLVEAAEADVRERIRAARVAATLKFNKEA